MSVKEAAEILNIGRTNKVIHTQEWKGKSNE